MSNIFPPLGPTSFLHPLLPFLLRRRGWLEPIPAREEVLQREDLLNLRRKPPALLLTSRKHSRGSESSVLYGRKSRYVWTLQYILSYLINSHSHTSHHLRSQPTATLSETPRIQHRSPVWRSTCQMLKCSVKNSVTSEECAPAGRVSGTAVRWSFGAGTWEASCSSRASPNTIRGT